MSRVYKVTHLAKVYIGEWASCYYMGCRLILHANFLELVFEISAGSNFLLTAWGQVFLDHVHWGCWIFYSTVECKIVRVLKKWENLRGFNSLISWIKNMGPTNAMWQLLIRWNKANGLQIHTMRVKHTVFILKTQIYLRVWHIFIISGSWDFWHFYFI